MEDKKLERLAWMRSEKKSEKGWAIAAGLALLLGFLVFQLVGSVTYNVVTAVLSALLLEAVVQPLLYWNHRVQTKRGYEKELLELEREQRSSTMK